MKTTRKHNTIKSIIAAMLTLAIALTSTTWGSITANAKLTDYRKDRTGMEDARLLNGTTITMKVGEEKKIDMTRTYGDNNQYERDCTNSFTWVCSDETIVSMSRAWLLSDGDIYKVSHVNIKAEKAGTATITATNPNKGEIVSITIKVTAPKVTAKQKKCKHVWKVTKRATCVKSGMKTCKKCKLQKVIKQKNHAFETETQECYEQDYYVIYQCGDCICEDPDVHHYHITDPQGAFECENWCEEEFSQLKYGSAEAALEACKKHQAEAGHMTGLTKYKMIPYYTNNVTYKDVTYCTQCGFTEAELDLMFKVNDPTKTIFKKDL